jgi:cell division protein FtsW
MARKLKSDKLLFLATLLLVCTSVVMVYSASAMLADAKYQQQYWFLVKQATWTLLGMFLLVVALRIDYRHYREPVVIWTAVIVAGLGLIAVLGGTPVNGARRWLGLGGAGVQPSEAAKLAAIFFTAAVLERRMDRIAETKYALLPVVILTGLFTTLIVAEPDYGTAVSLLVIVGAMVFAAGLAYRHIAGLAAVMLPVLAFVLWMAPYRRARLLAFLNPWDDPLGDGFQIIQSLISVGAGGVFGRGLMGGLQKLFFLPEPHTDFIYAVIGEELGLVGTSAILLCFAIITWRGLRAAVRAPDRFGALLAIGLTTMIAFQAFVNISVVLGLMPTKGIPLPFVSAGGSSLLISLVGMGILLNVSQHGETRGRESFS